MPLFYFHVRSGGDLIENPEGMECRDLAAAEAEAIRGARSIMSAELLGGVLHVDDCIEIHDADGQRRSTVAFMDAVAIVRRSNGGAQSKVRHNDN